MKDLKLTWDEMDEAERAVFGPRWQAPVFVILACLGLLGIVAAMFAGLGLLTGL
jgi:hypothetical protein